MDSTTLKKIVTQAAEKYQNNDSQFKIVTDFHITVDILNGMVVICDDEGNTLSSGVVKKFCSCDEEAIEATLKKEIAQIDCDGTFSATGIYKPFSFLLENNNSETTIELHIVDDEYVYVNDELLKGLDKELEDFLANLMNEQ